MSNIDKISKEALREVAEDAQKAHKWEGLENGLKADGYVSTTVRFIQRASPQTVLALLDKLEAAEDRIAELEELGRGVKQFSEFQICHYGATEDYAKGYIDCQNNYNKVLFAAAGKGE